MSLAVGVGLVVAFIGGAPLALDPKASPVVIGAPRPSPEVTSLAAAPTVPTSSVGVAGVPTTAGQPVAAAESVIKTAPTQFSGAAPKPVAPPAAMTGAPVAAQGAAPGTWAVVIGINDYPGSGDDLFSAVNDANDMAQALANFGVDGSHQLNLRDGQVNARTLLNAVNWLANHAGPESVAVFFFAGHVRKAPGGNEEIVTSDGSAISDRQLANALARVRANRSWVGIAACYGGGFTEVLRPGRVLTGAADANSLAYENSALGRSYMVEYMVHQAMLQNRASATVQTAFRYSVDRISREHPGREPVQFDHSDGALDLRTADAPPASPPPPESQPQPEPQPAPPANEPPASDRPGQNQHCTSNGLVRRCTSG